MRNMNIKYFKQETKYTCGAASMRIVLASLGFIKTEKQVSKLLKTNTVRGTWHESFSNLAEKLRLNYVVGRGSTIIELKKTINNKYIIIICYFIPKENVDHYAVIKKINNNYIVLADPFYGDNHKLPLKKFVKNWKSDSKWDNEKRWFIGIKK